RPGKTCLASAFRGDCGAQEERIDLQLVFEGARARQRQIEADDRSRLSACSGEFACEATNSALLIGSADGRRIFDVDVRWLVRPIDLDALDRHWQVGTANPFALLYRHVAAARHVRQDRDFGLLQRYGGGPRLRRLALLQLPG